MVCECCKQNVFRYIRDIKTENGASNIFLCEECEADYEANIKNNSDEVA